MISNDATKAFSMISNLWATIRKFAFVKCLDGIAQTGIGLQKSQALRKTLN